QPARLRRAVDAGDAFARSVPDFRKGAAGVVQHHAPGFTDRLGQTVRVQSEHVRRALGRVIDIAKELRVRLHDLFPDGSYGQIVNTALWITRITEPLFLND